jgi:phage shock protein A
MESKNLENTVKKMAIILEKLAKKVDELEKRVQKLELKTLAKNDSSNQSYPVPQSNQQPQSSTSSFSTGFLSSLLGSFAGMSLFSLLFNNNISAQDVAKETGISEDELSQIEEKLESIDEKLASIEENLDEDFLENNILLEDIYEDVDEDMDFGDFETDIG